MTKEKMNYFDRITVGSEQNIRSLLGDGKYKLSELDKKILFKNNVDIFNLELSYQCNRKCDYCPVRESNRQHTQILMSSDLLEKICRDLAEINYENRIFVHLYNEPLLDKNLEEKISLIKKFVPFSHVSFHCNGDKLNFKRLKKLSESGCDYITVTLHPPANRNQSETVINRRIKKLCEKLQVSVEAVTSTTHHTFNERATGVSASIYYHEFRALGIGVRISWPDWRNQGTNRGGLIKDHKTISFVRQQPCAKPFREFTVFYDGNVQPCCESFHDEKLDIVNIGSIQNHSIFEIYSSLALQKFRREVFDFGLKKGICASCTIADYSHKAEDAKRKKILSDLS